ncbi:MAG: hypothetical protein FH749_13420 [Firmicutes bacterium]|nr:hypothetical protein [Bacillota bacterium]
MLKWNPLIKFVVLLLFWLVISGELDWQHVVAGCGAALLVMLFWRRKGENEELFGINAVFYALALALVMLVDICRAAWHVAIIILTRRPIQPQFVHLDTPLRSRLARVLLANCITLTPGTLSVSLEGNTLLVHALTDEHAQSLNGGRVQRILMKMEG